MGLSKDKIAAILSVNNHYEASKWEYYSPNDSFIGYGEYSISKISFESADSAVQTYLNGAIEEINADMDTERKNYIVGFLNTNHYFNHHNWRVGTLGFVAGKEGDPTFFLDFDKAEEVIQDYREMLAGQGGVPHEPASQSESKSALLDYYDEDWNPIPSKVIDRLEAIGSRARNAKNFDDNAVLNAAVELIAKIRDDASVESSTMPSADEALEILNREEHNGLEWGIMAVSNHDSDVTLEYPELIGTAMYYRAKGAK